MNFKKVVVKKPAPSMVEGISTVDLGRPDYKKALKQHKNYIQALKKCGVEVTVLETDDQFPDSVFVEDPAIVTEKCAIITNPGAESRNGEIIKMKEALKEFFPENLEEIQSPGTLEGGDVMQVEDHFYIGLSERTNKKGAEQLIDYLEKYGYSGSIVEFEGILHLKTGIAYIGDNTMAATDILYDKDEFKKFKKIKISDEEAYAANCIRVNDYVIVPEGFAKTKAAIEKEGFATITVDVSEFRKLDGGLSCLSLRF